jgi:tetratricopeptide (TPR) repeat protein
MAAYQAAQNSLEQTVNESANLHRALGYLALHEHNYEQAQREIYRIRHDAANLEGYVCERRGDLQAAQTAYWAAIQLAEQAHYPYGKANAHMNLGCVYVWNRELSQAKEHLSAAIEYFARCNMFNKLGEATSNLALAYLQSKEYASAITEAQRARVIFEQLYVARGVAAAHQLLAEAYLALHESELAEIHVQQVLTIDDPTIQPDGLRLLGEIRLRQGALSEAESLILASLNLIQDKPYKILEGYSWRSLGVLYVAQHKDDQAHQAWQKALQIFTETGLRHEAAEIQARLTEA